MIHHSKAKKPFAHQWALTDMFKINETKNHEDDGIRKTKALIEKYLETLSNPAANKCDPNTPSSSSPSMKGCSMV